MPQTDLPTLKPTLEDVKNQFNSWRKNRAGRTPIPAELWEAAINLFNFQNYSVSKISKELKLNYTDFKKHLQSKSIPIIKDVQSPAFIELDYHSTFPQECVIEMEDGSGAKMKMCFRGTTDLDLLELGRSFWRKSP